MKSAARLLKTAIHAHTEQRTLEELAARGRKQFRVVSGEKIMRLIEAIVDDAIRQEAGELARQDRDRIVAETRRQFDSVMKLQAEQEDAVRRHRAEADALRKQVGGMERELEAERDRRRRTEKVLSDLKETAAEIERYTEERERRITELAHALEEERDARATAEARSAGEASRELVEVRRRLEERIRELEEEKGALETRVQKERRSRQEERQAFADRVRLREEEIQRETAALKERADKAERLLRRVGESRRAARSDLADSEAEVERLNRRVEFLGTQLEEARANAGRREEEGERSVADLRDELRQMREELRQQTERSARLDGDTLEVLLSRLGEREQGLEARFENQMERTIDEITRAIHRATASPIDDPVEATDALVARIFDRSDEMGTNLGSLAVDERSARSGISSSLERLRAALRNGESVEKGDGK